MMLIHAVITITAFLSRTLVEVELQAAGHAVAPRLVADVAVLASNGFLDDGNGIVRRHQAGRIVAGQHREIVEVIAGRESLFPTDAQAPADFRQGGALVV